MRANHQDLARAVKDKAPHRHDRRMALLEPLRLRFEVQLVLLQDVPQLAQVLHDNVRLGSA